MPPSRQPLAAPRRITLLGWAAAAVTIALAPAWAQSPSYPSRPVTLIVPFSAGGGVDSAARIVAARLGELLKQPVVVENVAGAAGTIGTQKAARAAADGYTLLFAVASPLNVAPLVSPSVVRYDTFKDFTPVATVGFTPFVLIGRAALPARTMADLVGLAKAQPGKLNLGTDGVGTSLHLTAELIKLRAGLDILHVPYKLGTQVLTDVAGGALDLAVLPLTLAQPFIKDGKVRAFGVTSKQRSPSAPDVPALSETAGLADFEVDSWSGVLVPAGVPASAVRQLVQAIESTMKDPEVVRRMGEIAVRPMVIAGPAFGDYLAAERRMLQDIMTRANIKAE